MAARKTWTDRRKAILEQWIELAKGRMGLQDWTVSVNWAGNELTHPLEGASPDAMATMVPHPSSKHAIMTVSVELLASPAHERHQTLVHEMAHCHFFAIHEYARRCFNEATEDNELAQNIFATGLTQMVETATDGWADALAELLPEAHLD